MSIRTVAIRGRRFLADDIDSILGALADRAYVVHLWRRVDGTRDEWVYLGESPPVLCGIEQIGRRFGAGRYRARICGRRDGYITHVEFGLDERAWPVTAETLERIRRHRDR